MSFKDTFINSLARVFGMDVQPARQTTSPLLYSVGNELPRSEASTLTAQELHAILHEAANKRPQRLFRLYTDVILMDSHVQSEFTKRLIAVSGDPDVLIASDDSPEAALMMDRFQLLINDLGVQFFSLKLHLLRSCLLPVSVAGIAYRASSRPDWYYTIAGFSPVDSSALCYDAPDGLMRIATGDLLSPRYILPTPYGYIIHRGHVLDTLPDYLGGPARALLFWWLFKSYDKDWWIEFLERWGQPFLKGKYDPADPEGKHSLARAFAAAKRLFGITISNTTEVEVMQISATSADAYNQFHGVATAEISKLIVGQTISSTASNVGLGGGQAAVHEAVRQDLRQFDALKLSFTIRDQVFLPLCRINGWPTDLCPKITFGGVSNEEQTVNGAILTALTQAGLELTDDGIVELSAKVGFPLQRKSVDPSAMSGWQFSAPHPPGLRAYSAAASRKDREAYAEAALDAQNKLVAATMAPYRRALGQQYTPILEALAKSKTRAEFVSWLRSCKLDLNPDAVEALSNAMTAAAANGILSAQPTL